MSWWGKAIGGGVGYALGGVLGGLLGLAIGHVVDRQRQGAASFAQILRAQERAQGAFFTATFSVMGHIAKSDGRVTEDEIRAASFIMQQMRLGPEQTKTAQELFRQGKQPDFPVEEVLSEFRAACGQRRSLLYMFFEIQVVTAMADGRLDSQEHQLLIEIARSLGVPQRELESIIRRMQAEQAYADGRRQADSGKALEQAYAVLGISENATDAEVKRAYRKLISQHHPDKLVSKGLPEEMMEIAKQKTQEIKQAYETIRAKRKQA